MLRRTALLALIAALGVATASAPARATPSVLGPSMLGPSVLGPSVAGPSVAGAAVDCPAAGGAAVKDAVAPAGAAVTVFGHGWGHGMGMSQYGAQGAARLGCDYRTILQTYYHDVSVQDLTLTAPVMLALAGAAGSSRIDTETGIVRWHVGGRGAIQRTGLSWTVVRRTVAGTAGIVLLDGDGRSKLFAPDGSPLVGSHTGNVVRIHATGGPKALRTRWDTTRIVGAPAGQAVTEVISTRKGRTAVQKYLLGLAEVPVSWPLEALKAQSVAARTYLTSKYVAAAGGYVIRTGSSDQVYAGYDLEEKDAAAGGAWADAVAATKGQVIVDAAGRPIEAMYSSSMGGYTENRQYAYGRYGISYLKAVDDSRWDNASDNPNRSWSKGFSKADLAKRFGFESVSAWSVGKRGSDARLAGVRITGVRDGSPVTVWFTGAQARSKLGLKSPGFTFG